MYDMGIRESLLAWSASFLQNRTQQVVVDGHSSDPLPVLSGVPQGTVLGPLFFLIYINDIHKNLSPGTKVRLFADDSLLYREIADISDSQTLQNDLDTLQRWESRNKMEFHPGKCTVMRFTHKREPILFTYNIHGTHLDTQNSAKYLGITLDTKLDWNEHINSVFKKACYMLSFLERNLQKCPQNVKEICFNALVRPILEYASCIWDPHKQTHIEKLEKIQKRAARFITGNRKFAHGNTARNYSLLDWSPLQERRSKLKATMMFKIKNNLIEISKNRLLPSPTPRRQLNFQVPHSKLELHKNSFFPSTIRLWNNLPDERKAQTDLVEFKNLINEISALA